MVAMSTMDSLVSQLGAFLSGPAHIQLPNDSIARNCYCFDWRARDEDFSMDVEDMFGDGSPEGFAMSEDDTLVPFAMIGISELDDASGQPEGMLFFDLGNGDQIIHIEIDGTAIFDSPQVVAASLADLPLKSGLAPEE
jgi:hypothetical protein